MTVQEGLQADTAISLNSGEPASDGSADNSTDRRHFFARLAGLGLKLAGAASLLPGSESGATAASTEAAVPPSLSEQERCVADVARLAANLAQPDTAVSKVAIYHLGEKRGDPTLQMVAPGLWRRCGAQGLEGEPITDAELGRSSVWGINADGQLVVHDSGASDADQAANGPTG
jgi:hypothetical protein